VDYYRGKGALHTVDGMAAVSDVEAAIGRALADAAFRAVSPRKAASARKTAPTRKKAAGKVKAAKRPAAKPAAKAAPRRTARRPQKGKKALRPRRLTK
jgi:hypothetical protein